MDDSILALVYRRKKDYETQISTFCCGCYRNCEIYGMLMEQKYT